MKRFDNSVEMKEKLNIEYDAFELEAQKISAQKLLHSEEYVFEKEKEYTRVRREHWNLPSTDPDHSVGLALSGGGVRSAAFCCGILEELEERGWSKKIDFISSVSGGSYLACSYMSFVHEAMKEGADITKEKFLPQVKEKMSANANYLCDIQPRRFGFLSRIFGFVLFACTAFITCLLSLANVVAISALAAGIISEFFWIDIQHSAAARRFIDTQSATGYLAIISLLSLAASAVLRKRHIVFFLKLTSMVSGALMLAIFMTITLFLYVFQPVQKEQPMAVFVALLVSVVFLQVISWVSLGSGLSRVLAFLSLLGPIAFLMSVAFFTEQRLFGLLVDDAVWSYVNLGCALYVTSYGVLTDFDFAVDILRMYYRKRLKEAFFKNGRVKDYKIFLKDFVPPAPYVIVNTCLNNLITPSTPGASQGHLATFTFGNMFVGCDQTQYTPSARVRDHSTATAMAVSGAALAIAAGKYDSRPFRLLLALANLSLGKWVPFPLDNRFKYYLNYFLVEFLPLFFIVYPWPDSVTRFGATRHVMVIIGSFILVCAILLSTFSKGSHVLRSPFLRRVHQVLAYESKKPGPWLYLSDGAHLENLGIMELLRRKAKTIVSCDAGFDVEESDYLSDLRHVLKFARETLRCSFVPIDDVSISGKTLPADLETSMRLFYFDPDSRCFRFSVIYDDGSRGVIHFLKLKQTAFDRSDSTLPPAPFPYHPTLDQFWDKELFLAYAEMGKRCVQQLLERYSDTML